MRLRDKIGLWILALAIPAAAAGVLFATSQGSDLERAARDCKRALKLGLPRPPNCAERSAPQEDAPAPERSEDAAAAAHQAVPADLPCYERRAGVARRWPTPAEATPVSRPAADGRGKAPSLTAPVERPRAGAKYVVREGDTFLGIVRRAYGSTYRWPEVWFENANIVREGAFLSPGTELHLPQ